MTNRPIDSEQHIYMTEQELKSAVDKIVTEADPVVRASLFRRAINAVLNAPEQISGHIAEYRELRANEKADKQAQIAERDAQILAKRHAFVEKHFTKPMQERTAAKEKAALEHAIAFGTQPPTEERSNTRGPIMSRRRFGQFVATGTAAALAAEAAYQVENLPIVQFLRPDSAHAQEGEEAILEAYVKEIQAQMSEVTFQVKAPVDMYPGRVGGPQDYQRLPEKFVSEHTQEFMAENAAIERTQRELETLIKARKSGEASANLTFASYSTNQNELEQSPEMERNKNEYVVDVFGVDEYGRVLNEVETKAQIENRLYKDFEPYTEIDGFQRINVLEKFTTQELETLTKVGDAKGVEMGFREVEYYVVEFVYREPSTEKEVSLKFVVPKQLPSLNGEYAITIDKGIIYFHKLDTKGDVEKANVFSASVLIPYVPQEDPNKLEPQFHMGVLQIPQDEENKQPHEFGLMVPVIGPDGQPKFYPYLVNHEQTRQKVTERLVKEGKITPEQANSVTILVAPSHTNDQRHLSQGYMHYSLYIKLPNENVAREEDIQEIEITPEPENGFGKDIIEGTVSREATVLSEEESARINAEIQEFFGETFDAEHQVYYADLRVGYGTTTELPYTLSENDITRESTELGLADTLFKAGTVQGLYSGTFSEIYENVKAGNLEPYKNWQITFDSNDGSQTFVYRPGYDQIMMVTANDYKKLANDMHSKAVFRSTDNFATVLVSPGLSPADPQTIIFLKTVDYNNILDGNQISQQELTYYLSWRSSNAILTAAFCAPYEKRSDFQIQQWPSNWQTTLVPADVSQTFTEFGKRTKGKGALTVNQK
jgi:hypothetical protein